MEYEKGRTFLFRVPEDEELVSYVNKFCDKNGIKMATLSAIGSLKKAKLGYFDISKGKYEEIAVEDVHELLLATGNVSIKEGKPFSHIHAILGYKDGSVKGGHLLKATVFVAELYIEELKGDVLERVPHGNLHLWNEE
ncbi:conserved domain protein [Aciduliprofundum boonei T469]|nr:conserved domain protein [Aciduliprofundum boonei T469]